MKKILFIFLLVSVSISFYAQSPEGFNYHATVYNEFGDPLGLQAVSFRFSIIKGSPTGTVVYSEKHNIITDPFGEVSLVIGDGIEKTGSFASINWGDGNYFLKVEIDKTGGTSYTEMGTNQLLSVPYALFAKTAANGFSGNYNDLYNKPVTNGSETYISAGNSLTLTGSGTSADPYILNTVAHFVGESFGGGIVFYVYDNGRHGLIAASVDQDPGIEWYNGVQRYTNTTGNGVGTGEQNTALIIAAQTNDNPVGNFAAKVCADYSVTVDGVSYGDWYLPSKHELDLMFLQSIIIGGFKSEFYWSSTELSSLSSWCQSFIDGRQYNMNKGLPYGVRAIRAF